MLIEPPILDGDDRVLQVGGDVVETDVVALFVEPEPRLAVGAGEDRVADAAGQPMYGARVARHPPCRHCRRGRHDDREDRQSRPTPTSGADLGGLWNV